MCSSSAQLGGPKKLKKKKKDMPDIISPKNCLTDYFFVYVRDALLGILFKRQRRMRYSILFLSFFGIFVKLNK